MTDETLTIEQAAALLDMDTVLVERALQAGALPSLRTADILALGIERKRQHSLLSEIAADLPEDYGPEIRKVLEGMEPSRKRPEGFNADTTDEPPQHQVWNVGDDPEAEVFRLWSGGELPTGRAAVFFKMTEAELIEAAGRRGIPFSAEFRLSDFDPLARIAEKQGISRDELRRRMLEDNAAAVAGGDANEEGNE